MMSATDRWLRQKAVAAFLGVSRFTLARIIQRDPTFPRFVELSPGIRVVRFARVEAWLRAKELATVENALGATTRTGSNKTRRAVRTASEP